MAEAVAAVALAGNVLQFLEATGKFVTHAFEILRHGANHSPTSLTRTFNKYVVIWGDC